LKLKPNQIIIGCSGYTESSEKDKCLSVGMKDYLSKPIDNMELEKVLNSYYYWFKLIYIINLYLTLI